MEASIHLPYVPAAPCASLLQSHGDQRDIPDDDPGFLESPGVTVSSSARVSHHQWNLPRPNLPPATARFLWVRGCPTCRCRSGTERRGSGRASRCCIWESCRFREAKLLRGAAGVLPSSRCTSGTTEPRSLDWTRTDRFSGQNDHLLEP